MAMDTTTITITTDFVNGPSWDGPSWDDPGGPIQPGPSTIGPATRQAIFADHGIHNTPDVSLTAARGRLTIRHDAPRHDAARHVVTFATMLPGPSGPIAVWISLR